VEGRFLSCRQVREESSFHHSISVNAGKHALHMHVRDSNPACWSGYTRNWSAIGAVTLNPERDAVVAGHAAADKQPMPA